MVRKNFQKKLQKIFWELKNLLTFAAALKEKRKEIEKFIWNYRKEEKKPEPAKQARPSENKQQQLKKMNQELSKMEEQISTLEKAVKDLEASLADDKIYNESNKLKETNAAYSQKKDELKQTQQKWEELAEQIMELEA